MRRSYTPPKDHLNPEALKGYSDAYLKAEYQRAYKLANSRLHTLGGSEVGKSSYIYQNNINRFTPYSSVSKADVPYALSDINRFLASPYSRVSFMSSREQKAFETFKRNYPEHSDMTIEQYRQFCQSMAKYRARKGRKQRYSDALASAFASIAKGGLSADDIDRIVHKSLQDAESDAESIEKAKEAAKNAEQKSGREIAREIKKQKYDAGRERRRQLHQRQIAKGERKGNRRR